MTQQQTGFKWGGSTDERRREGREGASVLAGLIIKHVGRRTGQFLNGRPAQLKRAARHPADVSSGT